MAMSQQQQREQNMDMRRKKYQHLSNNLNDRLRENPKCRKELE